MESVMLGWHIMLVLEQSEDTIITKITIWQPNISIQEKYLDRKVAQRLTPLRVAQSSKNAKKKNKIKKILSLYWNGIRWKSFRIFCPLRPLIRKWPENFLRILFLGILKLDFWIPFKILSGILLQLQYMFWCLVTP